MILQTEAPGIRLSSTRELIDAIGHARSVQLSAYALNPVGDLVAALSHAARDGAHVEVRIGRPFADSRGDLERKNERAIAELANSGAHVTKTNALEHLKAAVVDGTAYLDDRNWTTSGPETVIVDSRKADVAGVRAALQRGDASFEGRDFALGKVAATRLEHDLIASTNGASIDVQSETLTTKSRVEDALLVAACRGDHVRLIVSQDGSHDGLERNALEQLSRNGVEIRVGDPYGAGNEKFCVSGDKAWVGSANASWEGDGAGSLDWGLRSHDRAVADALHRRFEENWNRSYAFVA